ncbi:hypothetical protein [Bacteroides acidifaciens]|uniref:glucosamine inositolphosphorylceramide transferase family protein n=1 Tax=Bacteroides acidifaciens TaxID=85831 RepID=UPI0025A6212B|nr:hypothetical protein [Bacteroides acidifaciens]
MGNIFQKYECFGIEISEVKSIFDMTAERKIIRRLDTSSLWNIVDPKVINADPFLFVHNGMLFLFYEETTAHNPGGRLWMVSTSDLKNWTAPLQISHEDNLHFSFPNVFEDGGEVYMIPETGWVGEIRLYKATDSSLTRFELDSVLMRRLEKNNSIIFDFADNVLYKKDGIYFLFTSTLDSKGYQLQLYTSPTLRGPFVAHPCSPICHNLEFGRNAGSLIECDGSLYRPAQDCSQTYGGQVNVMKITQLTPEIYEETLFARHILPSSESFYRQGGHQLNYVDYKGSIIMATDAKRDRAFPVFRIADKIKRIIGLNK